jgi:hypothetical protein
MSNTPEHATELAVPEKVTLRWIYSHVPWSFYATLFGMLGAAFSAGMFAQSLRGEQHQNGPSPSPPVAPVSTASSPAAAILASAPPQAPAKNQPRQQSSAVSQKPKAVRRECLENEACDGARVLACLPRVDPPSENGNPLRWYLAPAHPDYDSKPELRGDIRFGPWSNPQCAKKAKRPVEGTGWNLFFGTCESQEGSGRQACAKVLVEYDPSSSRK